MLHSDAWQVGKSLQISAFLLILWRVTCECLLPHHIWHCRGETQFVDSPEIWIDENLCGLKHLVADCTQREVPRQLFKFLATKIMRDDVYGINECVFTKTFRYPKKRWKRGGDQHVLSR